MAYAETSDLQDRAEWELSAAELARGAVYLNDVELLIRRRIPDLDDQVGDGTIEQDLLVKIEADAVLRVLRNPRGFRSEQDGDYSYSRDSAGASGRLGLTDDEWDLLGLSGGAFTIAPYLEAPSLEPDQWVSTTETAL